MNLYDTATGARRALELRDETSIYVCGITPYDSAHLGHAFTFLTYDLLRRRLEDRRQRVRLVRNITDVDEPLYAKALELDRHYLDLAQQETVAFQDAMRALNLKDPDAEPRPSQHIEEIADTVRELLDRGYAYELGGDTYFAVDEFPAFGELSGYGERLQTNLARSRGGDPDRPGKRHPLDFLLWRSISDPADPAAWASPVGYGRPGWHIECTTLSFAFLGPTICVHGGGTDLIFPHHECERAQSMALGRDPFVRQWMHTAPMTLGGEKMSKSVGNMVFVRDLVKESAPAAVRIALMMYHYRTGGEWRPDLLGRAADLLDGVKHALGRPDGPDPRPYLGAVRAALDDDLDAPEAIRVLQAMTSSVLAGGSHEGAAAGLAEMLALLGVAPTAEWPGA